MLESGSGWQKKKKKIAGATGGAEEAPAGKRKVTDGKITVPEKTLSNGQTRLAVAGEMVFFSDGITKPKLIAVQPVFGWKTFFFTFIVFVLFHDKRLNFFITFFSGNKNAIISPNQGGNCYISLFHSLQTN